MPKSKKTTELDTMDVDTMDVDTMDVDTMDVENVLPNSLEGMPSEIQHRIAHFAGPQGENTMMLLNRDFHRRLAAFRAQQYRDEIADMLRCFRVRTNIDALITPNMPAVALRGIAACLSYLYQIKEATVSFDFCQDMNAVVKMVIARLEANPAEFFARAVKNNLPVKFTPENPPVFEEFIIGLLFNNNSLTKAILEFNHGKLCTGWLDNKNRAQAFFNAACIAGEHRFIASILQQHKLLNAASGGTGYRSPLSSYGIPRFFSVAAGFGHLETMQWLWAISSKEQQQAILAADDFAAFYKAARYGMHEITQWLWSICTKEQQQTMLAAKKYAAFRCAASYGFLDLVQWLWVVCPKEQQQTMLAADDFYAFREAVSGEHLKVAEWLWAVCPKEQQQTMLAACNFTAFREAACYCRLNVVQWLWAICSKDRQQTMLAAYEFEAFWGRIGGDFDRETVQWLWTQASIENKQQIRQQPFFKKLPEDFKQTLLGELSLLDEASQPEFVQTSMSHVL